jgi:hypothetical protein
VASLDVLDHAGLTDTHLVGESQFLTTPALAKPLSFGNLSLNDPEFDDDGARGPTNSDTRLMEMLAAQAAHLSGPEHDEQAVANDDKLSDSEKKEILQKSLNMAASNGDVDKVQKLVGGDAKSYIDINASDEDGTPPLIYASCFVSWIRPPALCAQGIMLMICKRATRASCKLSSRLGRTSTNKIATSGAL